MLYSVPIKGRELYVIKPQPVLLDCGLQAAGTARCASWPELSKAAWGPGASGSPAPGAERRRVVFPSSVSGQEAMPEVSLGESMVMGHPSVCLTTALTLGPGVRGGISHLYDD